MKGKLHYIRIKTNTALHPDKIIDVIIEDKANKTILYTNNFLKNFLDLL